MPQTDRNCSLLLLACVVLAKYLGVALGALLALPLVLYLPGHLILRQLRGCTSVDLDHVVFAFGLSVAVVIAGGFLLHLIGFMKPIAWAILLVSIPAVAWAIGGSWLPRGDAKNQNWSILATAPRRDVLMFALAAACAFSAYAIDRGVAVGHSEFKFTEFWMVSQDARNPNALTIGVKNNEGGQASYEVEVMMQGQIAGSWRTISLLPGETWTSEFNAGLRAGHIQRVEAWLFKDHDHRTVYRRVWKDI